MVDVVALRNSDFWKKKFAKACLMNDTNKSGTITRSDFELMIEKYQHTTERAKFESFSKNLLHFCDLCGLTDASVVQSYKEFEEQWLANISQNKDMHLSMVYDLFQCLDVNGSSFIDLKEWTSHCDAMGVPAECAKESFNAIDKDNDGKITLDEFVAYHAEFFYTTENKMNSAILFGPL
ncbi:Sarcoplasmic calcium-binding protein [Geodia barretti]|uniref:Sarcoplasmic calcium-binding protein n=1 Tax=Geodia barretti TaxID=519541 RepID=A0AA35WIH1_GEOBA|nr:Sarcoplasmic calcium-binding protein [Geodia barretti]